MGGESGWDVMKGFDGLPKLPEWESIQQKLDEAKAKSLEGMAAARKTSIELGAVAAVNASSLKTRLAADASKTFQAPMRFRGHRVPKIVAPACLRATDRPAPVVSALAFVLMSVQSNWSVALACFCDA